MKILRYTLAAFSVFGFLFVFTSTFFFSFGFNLLLYIIMLFFLLNSLYLVFVDELSQASRLLKTLAGYFAYTALELEYRAHIAEKKETIKSAEQASQEVKLAEARDGRLEAAEEFLRFLTTGARKQNAAPYAVHNSLLNPQSAITMSAPTKARTLSAPAQDLSVSDDLSVTLIARSSSISQSTDLRKAPRSDI